MLVSGAELAITLWGQPQHAVPQPALRFASVRLAFASDEHDVLAIDNVSLDIPAGKVTTVVGPSGCGKTTLLRLAAGLIKPSTGEVLCAGKAVSSLNADIAFVTQDSNLSSGLTALANVEFPLAARGISKNERRERAMHWLKLAGVEGFENSYPSQLSGDMQRRVSIVRTLISEPAVVLLDEPFGDFDAQTRMALDQKILELWAEKKNTMLFATHDLAEAITLSDHVVVMTSRPGRIKTIYDVPLARPRNVFEISVEPRFKDAYEDLWRLFRAELD